MAIPVIFLTLTADEVTHATPKPITLLVSQATISGLVSATNLLHIPAI